MTPKQFLDDIHALGPVSEIDVRINSGGGDIFAGKAIGNYLKTHPAKTIGYIDGLCASTATTIASACDVLKMPADALFMIHDPMVGLQGYYNKAELEKVIEDAEVIKESIIESYKAKTNLTDQEIYDMMAAETWLTGRQAKELGLVDELLHDNVDIQLSIAQNNRFLVVNNSVFSASSFKNMPQVPVKDQITDVKPPYFEGVLNNKKEARPLKLEEFKNQYPELFKEVVNLGMTQERKRIQDIENVAIPGFGDMINKAKFEEVIDAGQLSVKMIQAQKEKGLKALNERQEDALDLIVEPGEAVGKANQVKEEIEGHVNMISKFMKKGAK